MVIFPRRRFLLTLAGLVAAPTLVRAGSLMPIAAIADPRWRVLGVDMGAADMTTILAVRMPCLGINPVFELAADGTVIGQRHVTGVWDDWRGDVVDLRDVGV